MGTTVFPPVHDHAKLRESESQESSDGIEWNQLVRDATEEDQQKKCEKPKSHDAVGIDQAASAVAESMRQIIVLGNGTAEARKIGERGVRGKG